MVSRAGVVCKNEKSLPFQGRWTGGAGTERLLQICGNLSVSLRLTAPLRGEPLPAAAGGNLSGAARQLPLTRGALGAGEKKPPLAGEVARGA